MCNSLLHNFEQGVREKARRNMAHYNNNLKSASNELLKPKWLKSKKPNCD